MRPTPMLARLRGFTLLEMAVVMAVIGFIAVLVPRLVSDVATLQSTAKNESPLAVGEAALVGFVLANHRLPCPDVGSDGVEDCAGTARRGKLPYRSLGLPAPVLNRYGFALDYAVVRGGGADLTVVSAAFAPVLPESNPTVTVKNGLDFCQALRILGAATPPVSEPSSGGVGVPFVLADPGAIDADRAGGLFDLANGGAGLAFEAADRPRSDTYDDSVHAMSHAVLLGLLDCPRHIAAASGAAREADAAWDIWRAAVFYQAFREHGLRVRENAKESADFKHVMALYVNTVLTAALVANDLAVALSSGSGAAAIAVATVNSVIAVASAVYGVIEAINGQKDAAEALGEARDQKANADTNVVRTRGYFSQAVARALIIDARGWHQ
jgi:prepilin-type N-terminal cleavage/methylation domain-containing protein